MIYTLAKKFIWGQYLKNGFKNFELKTDTAIIDYWDNKKDGKVIILLHGFGAQTEFQWYKQIETLSNHYRVLIPNLLYFGNTEQKDKYQLQDQVNIVKTFCQNLNIQQFDLIGISYGGLIGIEFCNQNIGYINKLILVDSPIKYLRNEDLEIINNIYELNKIEELFAPKDYHGLKKQFKAAYYYRQFIPDFIYKILFENLCLPNVENWEKLITELKLKLDYYAKQEYLFEQSTLLIWGENDDIVPIRIAKELNIHIKNSKLEIIKKAKHLPNIEQSKIFNKIMIDFLLYK